MREIKLDIDRHTLSSDELAEKLSKKKSCRIELKRVKNVVEQTVEASKELVRSGRLHDDGRTKVVTSVDELREYIQQIKKVGYYSFDTETTGLDVFNDIIVGFSLYTPGLFLSPLHKKDYGIYVPLNHTDTNNQRVAGQLNYDDVRELLESVLGNPKLNLITHNGKFDGKIIYNQFGIWISRYYWDTLIGGKLLNENELTHGLKYLHAKYVLEDVSKEENFADLFGDKVPFNYVPIDIAGIYGAYDTIKTFELYLFQREYIESDREDMKKISHVLHDIEMPLIPILKKMELRGIMLDLDRARELQIIFEAELAEVISGLDSFVAKYEDKIRQHPELQRLSFKNDKLVFNYNSPAQVKAFIYDVLGCECVSWKYVGGKKIEERGTGEEIVKKLAKKYPKIPFFKELLRQRGISKLLNTYIIKMQNIVNEKNVIHCLFNQYGARTGRFSSQDPNLQNIPSHEKRIRTMFMARPGYVLVSADYSQIEPRILASLSGDEVMRGAYIAGEDLYSEMASFIFNKPVEECGDGTEERSATKGVLLGIMYDRTPESVAEEFGKPASWGREVVGKFFKRFQKVKNFVEFSVYEAEIKGYITTIDGRKRRLPDIQKDRNTGAYKQAHRQVVNSRIQGSACDILKKAMIILENDERLQGLEVYILLTVHDELIFEIKEEDVKKAIPIIEEDMIKAGAMTIDVPCKVDIEITKVWYGEKLNDKYLGE